MCQTLSGTWFMLMIAACPALAACENGSAHYISNLRGKWVLESIDGRAVESDNAIYFEIGENEKGEKTISGYDGCNRFAGLLDALDQVRGTLRGCPKELLRIKFSDPQTQLRSQLESTKLDGDTLDLVLANEGGKARFLRVAPR